MAAEITATCRTCQQKQAVNKSLRATTWEKSRRSKVKEFGDEVYLDTWFPRNEDTEVSGFLYGNLWTDLHICSKFDTPMRGRRDAADSLMDWIDYYGVVPKKILTDRGPELIGSKFIETCRSFSPPILPERAPTGIKRILGFAERPIRTQRNQVSGQNLPAAHPQGCGAPLQIGAIQGGAATAQEDGRGAAGIGGDDQDLGIEVQAEVPQQGAGPSGDSQRKYTGLLVEANGRCLVMMQTGKAYHKFIPAAWLQPVGDGSEKWRAEGIAPNPIQKQQVLRYFDFVDDRLPAKIESQVSPGPPPIGVGLSAQQQGVVNEGVPPDAGGDIPAAPHPDGIPPDDSLFGSDLLRNPQHEGGAEQGSMYSELLETLAAFDFKKGSTNILVKEEEVREGKFNKAMRDEWLQNICGQEVFGRAVPREEAKMAMDLSWRLTWKEKETEKGKVKEGKNGSPSPSHSPPTATKRVLKARCFGKGFQDKRKIDTFTGTPVPALIFFCMIWALACAL